MRTPRIYVSGNYNSGEVIKLDAAPTHHLTRVLRRGPGDDIIVFNGVGQSFVAQISALQRGAADIEILAADVDEPAPATPICLALAVLKNDTLDYVLQKATELGVSDVHLVASARAEARHTDPIRRARRIEHWLGILVSACEQSGRNWLPTLSPPRPFAEWLPTTSGQRWLLHPGGRSVRDVGAHPGALTLAIGPEGGWTEEERGAAERAGFTVVSLGPRILRADTAPVVALTLAQYLAHGL